MPRLRSGRRARRAGSGARDARRFPEEPRSYALPQAAGRKEAERTNNQDKGDNDKDERLPEWTEGLGQQGLQQDRGDANEKAADRGSWQAAKTADDGADEGDHDELEAHPRLDETGLGNDH